MTNVSAIDLVKRADAFLKNRIMDADIHKLIYKLRNFLAGKPYWYAHMCRDDHLQIGHADSEHENCPLCRALNELERLHEKNGWQSTSNIITQLRGTVEQRTESD